MNITLFPHSQPVPGAMQLAAMNAIAALYANQLPTANDQEALGTIHRRITLAIQTLTITGSNDVYCDDVLRQCYWLILNCSPTKEDSLVSQAEKQHARRYQTILWLNKWEERFFGWLEYPELETLPRMQSIMTLLHYWSYSELIAHTDENRGFPHWLIKQGIWKENKSAGFNQQLERHVTHDEI